MTNTHDYKKAIAIGLIFNCPHGKHNHCHLNPLKQQLINEPKAITSISDDTVNQIINGHLSCEHCLNKNVIEKFINTKHDILPQND